MRLGAKLGGRYYGGSRLPFGFCMGGDNIQCALQLFLATWKNMELGSVSLDARVRNGRWPISIG